MHIPLWRTHIETSWHVAAGKGAFGEAWKARRRKVRAVSI